MRIKFNVHKLQFIESPIRLGLKVSLFSTETQKLVLSDIVMTASIYENSPLVFHENASVILIKNIFARLKHGTFCCQ